MSIRRFHLCNTFLAANETDNWSSCPISGDTVRRGLRINNLSCRRPARRPNPLGSADRIVQTGLHSPGMALSAMENMVFTDETHISTDPVVFQNIGPGYSSALY